MVKKEGQALCGTHTLELSHPRGEGAGMLTSFSNQSWLYSDLREKSSLFPFLSALDPSHTQAEGTLSTGVVLLQATGDSC